MLDIKDFANLYTSSDIVKSYGVKEVQIRRTCRMHVGCESYIQIFNLDI